MQRLIYTVDIDEEIYGLDSYLLDALDYEVTSRVGCNVIKSRLELPEEIIENGEWEDDENE